MLPTHKLKKRTARGLEIVKDKSNADGLRRKGQE
jgi:hypothetical protein